MAMRKRWHVCRPVQVDGVWRCENPTCKSHATPDFGRFLAERAGLIDAEQKEQADE